MSERPLEDVLALAFPAGVESVTPLAGGLTNVNHRVATADGTWVLRRWRDDPGLLAIDRDAEFANSVRAWRAGAGPEVAGSFPDLNALVVRWVEGPTLSAEDLRRGDRLGALAAACRRLHAGERFAGDFDMWAVQARYREVVRARGFRLPEGYDALAPRLAELRAALAVHAGPTVPCHNDLLAENLIDAGDRLVLIDFEYGGNNDPCFELGNLAAESALSPSQLEQLVTAYYGEARPRELARARLWGTVASWGWTLWASIQDGSSPLDFDFWAWGQAKYARLLAELADSELAAVLAAARGGGAPTAAAFRDLEPDTLRAPWALYDAWREAGPVVELPELGGWVVTRHAVALEVLRDPGRWSSDTIEGPVPAGHAAWLEQLVEEEPELQALLAVAPQTLLALDPPAHGRLRKVLVEHLSAARIGRLAPAVEAHVAAMLPALLTGEPVDAVAAFTEPLPLRIVGTLLGLEPGALDAWRALAAVASTSNPHRETADGLRARITAELGLLRRFEQLLAAPASPLAADLAGAVAAGELTAREAAGLCREILVAGSETSGDLLASILAALARDPALLATVREDPGARDALVEEVMRLESPFPGFWRRATRDTVLGGVAIPAGGLLLVAFGAANRDPARFPDPAALRLDRPQPRGHLAFGNGIHFCVGAPLARLQIGGALTGLLERTASIELLVPEADLRYRPSVQARGLAALPLRLQPVDRGQTPPTG